ncbi:hypothetical protein SCOR_23840 [Sulfidibacter corallicola]
MHPGEIFPFIIVLAVIATVFVYKLAKLYLEARYGPLDHSRKKREKKPRPQGPPLDQDGYEALQQRSAELNRRLANLEEILRAEHTTTK